MPADEMPPIPCWGGAALWDCGDCAPLQQAGMTTTAISNAAVNPRTRDNEKPPRLAVYRDGPRRRCMRMGGPIETDLHLIEG